MRKTAFFLAAVLASSAWATDANLPAGAIARMGDDRFRMPPRMTTPAPGQTPHAIPRSGLALCWSLDGKEIFWADTGGQLVAWDANTGQVRRTFDIGRTHGNGACFSQDGRFLCAALVEQPGSVTFWSTADGKQAGTYSSGAKTAAITPAGQARFLLHAGRPPYHVYDAAAGKAVAVITVPSNNIAFTSVAGSPDGTALAVSGVETKGVAGGAGRNRFLQVLDLPSGKQRFRAELDPTDFSGTALVFTPDGKNLLHCGAGIVPMLSADDGKEVKKLQTSIQYGQWMVCSPDGKYVGVGGSPTSYGAARMRMEVIDLAEGKARYTLPLTAYCGVRAAFSPDSKTIALSTGLGGVMLVEAATGRQIGSTGHCGGVTGLDISPDGKTLASVGADCCTYLWRLPEAKVIRGWFGADTPVGRVAFSRSGRLVAVAAGSPAVRLYDVASGDKVGQVDAATIITDLSRWPGRDTFAIRKPMSLGEVIPATGKEGRDIAVGHNTKIAIRPDGAALFVAGLQRQIAVCDANSGTQTLGIPMQGAMSQLDLTGDGLLLAVGLQPEYARLAPEAGIVALPGRVELLETATGKSLAKVVLWGTLAFSPDGRLLAIGQNDGLVRVWSLMEAKDVAEFRGHTGAVSAVKWTPDGKALASGAADGQVYLWDTAKLAAAPAAGKLDADRLNALYAELGDADAAKAFAAVRELARGGAEARTFLVEQLAAAIKPAAVADGNRVDGLIADLDSPKFAVRKAADDELAKMGDAALPALRAALKRTDLSTETRARLEVIAHRKVKAPVATKDALQLVRALLALRLNDPAAGADAAAKLAAGDPAAEITPLAATVNACIKTTAADRDAWKTAPTTAPAVVPTTAPAVAPAGTK